MMRKREKELETLLKEKNMELEKAQREIESIKADALEIKKRFEERDAYAQKLQTRESDVVAAFAEIQNTRNRKIKETEDEVRQMKDNAARMLDNARLEADSIKQSALIEALELKKKAENEAESVMNSARAEADEIRCRMRELQTNAEEENAKMKLHLTSIAQQCKEHIAALEEKVSKLNDIDTASAAYADEEVKNGEEEKLSEKDDSGKDMETAQEDKPVEDKPVEDKAAAEEEGSPKKPSEVMKSIYEIEKRDLPNSQESDAKPSSPDEPDHVWTVDEIVDSVMDNGEGSEDDYLEKLIGEILQ